jgi:hypothetical protein
MEDLTNTSRRSSFITIPNSSSSLAPSKTTSPAPSPPPMSTTSSKVLLRNDHTSIEREIAERLIDTHRKGQHYHSTNNSNNSTANNTRTTTPTFSHNNQQQLKPNVNDTIIPTTTATTSTTTPITTSTIPTNNSSSITFSPPRSTTSSSTHILPLPVQFYIFERLHSFFKGDWNELVNNIEHALQTAHVEHTWLPNKGLFRCFIKSMDHTASHEIAQFDILVWEISNNQNLVELVLKTDDSLDQSWNAFFNSLCCSPKLAACLMSASQVV